MPRAKKMQKLKRKGKTETKEIKKEIESKKSSKKPNHRKSRKRLTQNTDILEEFALKAKCRKHGQS